MSYAFLYGEKPCVSRNFNNRFQFWNVFFRFRRFICFGMQYKKSKEERQRGKNSMNDAQLRRRELLRQTKQLYGERETVPPIHPRYGNLCKEQDEGGEEAGGSFYMRLVIVFSVSSSLYIWIKIMRK